MLHLEACVHCAGHGLQSNAARCVMSTESARDGCALLKALIMRGSHGVVGIRWVLLAKQLVNSGILRSNFELKKSLRADSEFRQQNEVHSTLCSQRWQKQIEN